jgi:hypothetical protein
MNGSVDIPAFRGIIRNARFMQHYSRRDPFQTFRPGGSDGFGRKIWNYPSSLATFVPETKTYRIIYIMERSLCVLLFLLGVPYCLAEITPVEPGPGNAG